MSADDVAQIELVVSGLLPHETYQIVLVTDESDADVLHVKRWSHQEARWLLVIWENDDA